MEIEDWKNNLQPNGNLSENMTRNNDKTNSKP